MPQNNPFQQHALDAVALRVNQEFDGVTTEPFLPVEVSADDFYVVWFVKVLQDWKALVSTDLVPGHYFEVTYNGDRLETYVDWYEKKSNVAIPDAVPTTDHHLFSD